MDIKKQEFIERVKHDFTYKAPSQVTQQQREMWQLIKQSFFSYSESIGELIDKTAKETKQDVYSDMYDEYLAYKTCLRSAERACNTAVANDYNADGVYTIPIIIDLPYTGYIVPHDEEVLPYTRSTENVSILTYGLVTKLVQFVPHGRALSIAMTQMQEVRGWLNDLFINYSSKVSKTSPDFKYRQGEPQHPPGRIEVKENGDDRS